MNFTKGFQLTDYFTTGVLPAPDAAVFPSFLAHMQQKLPKKR